MMAEGAHTWDVVYVRKPGLTSRHVAKELFQLNCAEKALQDHPSDGIWNAGEDSQMPRKFPP